MIRASFIFMVLALALAGCFSKASAGRVFSEPTVLKDWETGCEYLSWSSSITPRIDSDGLSHRGCRKNERASP